MGFEQVLKKRAKKLAAVRAKSLEYAQRASKPPSEYLAAKQTQKFLRPKPPTFYGKYLQSADWRAFRLTVLAKRGTACEVCKVPTKRPQIHHLTYERLGKELQSDVVVTCDACHRHYHGLPSDQEIVAGFHQGKIERRKARKQRRAEKRKQYGCKDAPAPVCQHLAGTGGLKNETGRSHLSGHATQSGIIEANGVARDR